jgi:hypothetical protein
VPHQSSPSTQVTPAAWSISADGPCSRGISALVRSRVLSRRELRRITRLPRPAAGGDVRRPGPVRGVRPATAACACARGPRLSERPCPSRRPSARSRDRSARSSPRSRRRSAPPPTPPPTASATSPAAQQTPQAHADAAAPSPTADGHIHGTSALGGRTKGDDVAPALAVGRETVIESAGAFSMRQGAAGSGAGPRQPPCPGAR